MKQLTFFIRNNREPCESRNGLMRVRGKSLALGKPINIGPQIPKEMVFRRIAKPLNSVGEYGNGSIVHRGPLNRPARIADHYFIQGETFLGPANEQASPEFGNLNHDSCFPYQEGMRGPVIHDAAAPREPLPPWESSTQNETGIAKFYV